jgi:hypothetical protein
MGEQWWFWVVMVIALMFWAAVGVALAHLF